MKGRMSIKSILALCILVTFSFMFLNMSLAASTTKIVVETANVRQNPSTDSVILKQVSLNDEVEILEIKEDWIKVKAGNTVGYLKSTLTDVQSQNLATESIQEDNTNETIEETSEEAIENNVEENKEDIEQKPSDSELGEYYVVSKTNLKLVPLINATNMQSVNIDTKIEVLNIANNWAYAQIEDSKGWIALNAIKSKAQIEYEKEQERIRLEEEKKQAQLQEYLNARVVKTVYATTKINFREGPDGQTNLLKTFDTGKALSVIGTEGSWYRVREGQSIGYVSTQYVSDTNPQAVASRANVNRTYDIPAASGGIVQIAQQYLGVPYRYGGTSPVTGFDCSGFTQYVYAQAGISLNRTAAGQLSNGVRISLAEAQPGDLVIYNGGTHVAIYVGNNTVIHSPRTGYTVTYAGITSACSSNYQVIRVAQ